MATQSWDPVRYARNAGFVAELGLPVLSLLAPRRGERILDIGCGDGTLTRKLMDAGAAVIGVDSSAEQIAAAVKLGIDARIGSGETLDFAAEFDAVFSNAALHWMLRPERVIDGVWRALRPGGRFVGEFGGDGNVRHIVRALVAALDRRGKNGAGAIPWYFPTPEAYGALLTAQGFALRHLELFPRPTPLPEDIVAWLETFAENFIRQVSTEDRPAYLAEVAAALAPHLRQPDGRWFADYVRLRFAAEKPAARTSAH